MIARVVRLVGEGVFVVLSLATALLMAAVWRLGTEPVSLDPWISVLEAGARDVAGSGRVRIGSAYIYWVPERAELTLALRKVRYAPSDAAAAREETRFDEVHVALATAALLRGVVAPREVWIKAAALGIALEEGKDGNAYRAATWDGESGATFLGGRIVDRFLQALRAAPSTEDPLTYLERVRFEETQVRVAFGDGRVWRLRDAHSDLFRSKDAVDLVWSGNVEGRFPTWKIEGMARAPDVGDSVAASLTLTHAPASEFARLLPGSERYQASFPIDGHINAEFLQAEGGLDLLSLHIALASSGGAIRAPEVRPEPFQFSLLDVRAKVDLKNEHIAIERLAFRQGDNYSRLEGSLATAEGGLEIALRGRDVPVGWRGALRTFPLRRLDLLARLDLETDTLHVLNAEFDALGAQARFSGALAFGEAGTGLSLRGEVADLTLPTLVRLWPTTLAPETRMLVRRRALSGRIAQASLRFDAPPAILAALLRGDPLPEDADLARVDARFEEVVALPIPRMRLVHGLSGRYLGAWDRQEILLDSGYVLGDDETRRVSVVSARVAMGGLGDFVAPEGVSLAIQGEARLTGSVPPLLSLIGEITDALPLRPASAVGTIDADIAFAWEEGTDPDYNVSARLRDFGYPDLIDTWDIADAELTLRARPKHVDIKGQVSIEGVPFGASWRWDTADDGAALYQYTAKGVASADALADLNIDLRPWIIGDVRFDFAARQRDDEPIQGSLRADLAAAQLTAPIFLWQKPRYTAALATMDMTISEAGMRVDDFQLSSRPMFVAADFGITWQHGLVLAELHSIRVPNKAVASGKLVWNEAGDLSVHAKGRFVDGQPLVDYAFAPLDPEADSGGAVVVDVGIDSMLLKNDQRMTDLSVQMAMDTQGRIVSAAVAGRLGEARAPFRAEVVPPGQGEDPTTPRPLRLRTGDFGALLDALDITSDMRGGDAAVRGTVAGTTGDRTINASVEARRYGIANTPALNTVMAISSLGLSRLFGDLGEGVARFSGMDARLRLRGSTLFIDEGHVRSAALGATFSGAYDTAKDYWEMSGVLTPFYAVNAALGKIPLVSKLFGGKKGLIGVAFAASGPSDDLSLKVNAASALLPGFLRNAAEFSDPAKRDKLARDAAASAPQARSKPQAKPRSKPAPRH